MRKKQEIEYDYFDSVNELQSEDQKLVDLAEKAMSNAYAPYSHFKVGASLLLESGEIVTGSNQENVAYPSGLCAERVALFYAGANYPNESAKTICIVASGDLVGDSALSPCGGCRQVMVETENRQNNPMRVILVNQDGSVLIFNSSLSLLPLAFGS